MKPTDKSQVYRQLYHAANGMENRFLRPSASSLNGFSKNGPSPLLNAKVIGLAIGIGVSLAAVFAAVRSLGKDDEPSKEEKEVTEPVKVDGLEELDPKEVEEEVTEVVTEDPPEEEDLGVWAYILDRMGLGPKDEDPGLVDDLPEPSTDPVRIDSASPKDDTPKSPKAGSPTKKAPVGKDQTRKESGPPEKGMVAISRGHKLDKSKDAKRTSQQGNALFTGRYMRLSKANLSSSELMWATRLVKMGVPIGGRMGKSLLPVVKSVIIARAKAYGLNPADMLKVASMESGGDPNAVSSTGAIGVYQFTAATARAFGLNNRFDLDANVDAGMLLARENLRSLPEKTGGALAMYIAHQIGISSAKEVLASPVSKKITELRSGTQRSIRVNVGGKSKTVGEYLEANRAKLNSSYAQQMAAAPFKGSIRVHLASGTTSEKVSSIDASFPEEVSFSNTPAPTTTVVPETPPEADKTFHAKVDLPKPTAGPAREKPAEDGRSSGSASPHPEPGSKFQSAFVSNNGSLVVM